MGMGESTEELRLERSRRVAALISDRGSGVAIFATNIDSTAVYKAETEAVNDVTRLLDK